MPEETATQERSDTRTNDTAENGSSEKGSPALTSRNANVADHYFECAQLDPETFQVTAFSGEEEISDPYSFTIDLVSKDPNIDFAKVIGRPAVFTTMRGSEEAPFCGIVTAIRQTGRSANHFYYKATLEPRLVRLQRASHSRVFQHCSVQDIITEVLKEAGLRANDFRFELKKTYPQREYCVQHKETDFNFISRLMEHEGICYFFEHETGSGETLVMADHRSAHTMIPDPTEVLYRKSAGMARDRVETIQELTLHEEMTTGKVALKDYNYRTPETGLSVGEEAEGQEQTEQYEYGDHHGDAAGGQRLAKVRSEEIACGRRIVTGDSDCAGLRPGHTFTLEGHFRKSLNEDYLIIKVEHEGSQGSAMSAGSASGDGAPTPQTTYGNTFTCIPARVPFRPERDTEVPKVEGLMTAKVETAGGPYAYLDEEGRYRAKMDFDRSDRTDGRASLPIRMAQSYSGPGYGMHFPNHAGTEMVWACINGDPDRPMALGTVPNPSQTSPAISENRMQNVIRTWSGNELVMDDTQDEEEISMQTPDTHRLLMSDKEDRVRVITTGKHTLLMDDRNENVEIKTTTGHFARLDDKNKRMTLQSKDGHRLLIDDKNENITIEDHDSQNRLVIDIGEDTIDLVSEKGSINIKAPKGELNLEAKEINATSSENTNFEAKNMRTKVKNDYSVEARDVKSQAGNNSTTTAGNAAEVSGGTSVTTTASTNNIVGGTVNVKRG